MSLSDFINARFGHRAARVYMGLLGTSLIAFGFWGLFQLAITDVNASRADTGMQQQLVVLAGKMRRDEIERLEILNIPARVRTRVRITPEALDAGFEYKVTIRDLRGSPYRAELLQALESEVAGSRQELGDLRWAIAFYDSKGDRAEELYVGSSGRDGALNGRAVSLRGSTGRWLVNRFSTCFK